MSWSEFLLAGPYQTVTRPKLMLRAGTSRAADQRYNRYPTEPPLSSSAPQISPALGERRSPSDGQVAVVHLIALQTAEETHPEQ